MTRAWTLLGLALLSLGSLVSPALADDARDDHAVTALAPVEVVADGFKELEGVAVDGNGNVFVADRDAGTVTRLAPDHTRTVIVQRLKQPIGVALDGNGRVLIAESAARRVVRVEPTGALTTLASGAFRPRWLAVRDDGTVFIAARQRTGDHQPDDEDRDDGGRADDDDDGTKANVILALSPGGQLRVFASGFRSLQGLAVNHAALYAATRGRAGAEVPGVVFQMAIQPDGTVGAVTAFGPSTVFRQPIGLARDHLGALFLSAKRLRLFRDDGDGDRDGVVAKLHPDGHVTAFARGVDDATGLAFDAHGHLYVANGRRLLRFRAPAPPALASLPAFTNHSPLGVSGTAEAGARVDVFVNDAATPVTVTADGAGRFSAEVPLALNASNTLEVFATAHGGDGLTSAATTATVVHDDIPPSLAFHAPPEGAFVRLTVSVQAQAMDAGSGVASLGLSADSQPLAATVAPALPAPAAAATASWDTTTVADGTHTLGASATDRADNHASVSRVVIVDNTPPDTQITAGPDPFVNTATVTFTFTGTDNLTPVERLVFAWRVDGGAFTAFTSATTATLTGLGDGAHTFEVKARDLAGNEDATPATRAFTVDTVPPAVVFQAPADGAYVRQTVAVRAQATDSGSQVASLALTVDTQGLAGTTLSPAPPAPAVTATTSWNTVALPDGAHTLGAAAKDRAGNTGSATRTVTVDNTPPRTQITAGPPSFVNTAAVTFTFTGTDNLTPVASLVFAWRLDGGAFTAFTPATTATFAGLGDGAHTFEVKARDLAGNEDPTPATRAFTVDTRPPAVAFQAPASGGFVRQTVTVQAQATDAGSGVNTLTLAVDGAALGASLSPAPPAPAVTATASWNTLSVADGTHTLAATATDRASNGASAALSVIVDNTPPETQIVSGPSGELGVTTATFTFTGTDNLTPVASLRFAWRLDGGAFTAFAGATSATVTGLSEAPHTFEVVAQDLAGNVDATPASRTFTVRLGPLITSVEPASAVIGTFVTLTGAGFEPGSTTVSFNGVAALVRTITPTAITTTVPLGATTGALVVTTPRGSASRAFTVTATGDFTLTSAPAMARAIAGDQTSISVGAGGSGSFTSVVSLALSTLPAGITASVAPAPFVAPGADAFVTLAIASTVAPGDYGVTVIGTATVDGGATTRTTSFSVQVLAPDTKAITGRVLTAEAVPQPIPGATVTVGAAFTLTDAGGNFVLLAPPTGANMVLVDGRTASTPSAQYPPVEVNLPVSATGPTRVPFIVYLPKLDTAHAITLPTDATGTVTQTVQATPPLIPGLIVTIPQGTRIIGPDGNPVTQITITPVPIDRSPMPFPAGVFPRTLFTIQPGGAVPSQPLPITFPNAQDAPPGTKADLYFFDLVTGNWSKWGQGTVSADGAQVVSDPGAGLPRFAWHWYATITALATKVRNLYTGGEPVDLGTGAFSVTKTDLVLPGRTPISLERSYRSDNTQVGAFGVGWNLGPYDARLTDTGAAMVLTTADQNSYTMRKTGTGQWTFPTEPAFLGAVVTQLPGDFIFQIRFKDGTVQRFERIVGFSNLAALTTITDRNGNTVTITREGSAPKNTGRITKITEPSGRFFTLSYDTANRITAVTDPLGRTVSYSYDASGRLSTVTDAAGGVTTYTYDGTTPRIATITDPRGITFLTNEYAGSSVVRQTQADGGVWKFQYVYSNGSVIGPTATGASGGRAIASRGSAPTVARPILLAGLMNLDVDRGADRATLIDVEPRLRLMMPTDVPDHMKPAKPMWVAQSDGFFADEGSVIFPPPPPVLVATMVTDPRGNVTLHRFDGGGFRSAITDAQGQTTTVDYFAGTNLVKSTTDALGRITRFTYDEAGNVTSITDPAGKVRSFTYEAVFKKVTSITDPLGSVTRFAYDPQGNLITITDPLGNTTTIAYNGFGQPTRTTDAVGQTTTFTYDASGNLATIADPLGNTTTRLYDAVSRLIQQTDPRGNNTAFAYDPLNRLTELADALGGVTRFGYDGNGNVLTVTDARGNATTHTYDSMDRLASRTDPVKATETFRYDGNGNLTQHIDRKGQVATFGYDPLNRRTSAVYADATVNFTYDAVGRLVIATDTAGGTIENQYDELDRLTAQVQPLGTISYQYDVLGRRTQMQAPGVAPVLYGYDAASRLTTITQAPLTPVTIDYDAAGRRTKLTLPNQVSTEYQYDTASRLTALIYRNALGSLGDLSYTYDAAGNRTGVGGSFARTLFPDPVATAQYDAANRQLQFGNKALTFDANGNTKTVLDSTGSTVLSWDPRNRLTRVENDETAAVFTYDVTDGRLSRSTNSTTTKYILDGTTIIEELSAADPIGYLGSTEIDEPLVRGANEFLLTDGLGSIIGLTDVSGAVSAEYAYEPFGKALRLKGTSANPFQFTARENDGIGLYFYRARYYSPILHRFLSEDPLQDHGIRTYIYVNNGPLSNVDPLGLTTWPGRGTVASEFGPRRGGFHQGIDIRNSIGGNVVVSDDGVVVKINRSSDGKPGGNEIVVRHSDGSISIYSHTDPSGVVVVNQAVHEGQPIGRTDLTGNSEVPHVHYQWRPAGGDKFVNPRSHLPRDNNYPTPKLGGRK